MPPRHAYWTIILDGVPTAFRARRREELLPTLRQLQARHPDAVLKWFAHGRVWDSPEHARAERERQPRGPRFPDRGLDWRPGGAHRDARLRFAKSAHSQRSKRARPPGAGRKRSP